MQTGVHEKGQRVALFILTADPPHKAHALVVRKLLALREETSGKSGKPRFDAVWLVPCGERVDKAVQAPYATRVALARALAADVGSLRVRVVELDKGFSAQAAGVLARARSAKPGARFTLAFGPDNLLDFATHASWRFLLSAPLVFVVPFKSWNAVGELRKQGVRVPRGQVTQLVLNVPIHSRDVRLDVSKDRPFVRSLTPRVVKLVKREGLYRALHARVNGLVTLRAALASGKSLDSLVHPLALGWYAGVLAGRKTRWGSERLAERMRRVT